MAVARGLLRFLLLGTAVVLLLVVGGILFLTRTAPGVDLVSGFALNRVESGIQGSLHVGDVASGNLLEELTLHDVVVTDHRGRPFVVADSIRVGYGVGTFLMGAVVLDRVEAFAPDVTIEKLPGESDWNYARIFAGSDTAAADTVPDEGSDAALVLIRGAVLHDGVVTVRWPWEGPPPDTADRVLVEAVPGGLARVLRFQEVHGGLPEVLLSSPEVDGQMILLDGLGTRGYVWPTPFQVDALTGRVVIHDSVLTFAADSARMPSSRLRGEGRIIIGADEPRYDIQARGSDVAFRDFQWIYPSLPAEGGGSLSFIMRSREDGMLWRADNAALSTSGSEVTGSFGIVTGDSLYFTGVDLRASPLDLEFLAGFLPGDVPLRGLIIGTLEADGPLTALRTRGDMRYRTFDAAGGGAESEVAWSGTVGTTPPYRVRDLNAELREVSLAQAAQFAPALRIRGPVRGSLQADGSLDGGLELSSMLTLQGDGPTTVEASGSFSLGEDPTFDLRLDADPVSLAQLSVQFPELGDLQGEARGPLTVRGTLDDLELGADLSTPAGELVVQGRLALGPRPEYQAQGSVDGFRVDRVLAGAPETLLTAGFSVDGAGFAPESITGTLSLDVDSSTVAGVAVRRGTVRVQVSDGLVQVDTLQVVTAVGDAEARGTFGLVAGRPGELEVTAVADSLFFLEPVFFSGAVPNALGLPQESRIEGRVEARATLMGALDEWTVEGAGRVTSLTFDELQVEDGNVELAWSPGSLQVDGGIESLRLGRRRLASAWAAASWDDGRGHVVGGARGMGSQVLEVESDFDPQGQNLALTVQRLNLTTREGEWTLEEPVSAMVGPEGFRTDTLTLDRDTGGRIRAAGTLPWRPTGAEEVREASLAVDLQGVSIAEILRVAQVDTTAAGMVSGRVRVAGTASAPRMNGDLSARDFRYAGARLDSVRLVAGYQEEEANARFSAWRDGSALLEGEGRVPVRLTLQPEDERLLDRPMDAQVRARGVPVSLLGFLAPGFDNLQGRLQGDLLVVGTAVSPDMEGTMEITDGSAYFTPLEVQYRRFAATVTANQGSTLTLNLEAAAGPGDGAVEGTLDLATLSDPTFDLTLTARRLAATQRRDVSAVVNGTARLQGRYSRPVVSGDVDILQGELNLDELLRQYQVVQLDTSLFQVLDTAQVSFRPDAGSPFLENMQVTDASLELDRNFWIRSQELNIEVEGTLGVEMDRQADDLRLTGTLQVIRGTYELLARQVVGGRRFSVQEGTIEFVGTPGVDPNLDIQAAYRVRRPQGDPIDVIARVTGTLQDPRVSLTSGSDLPLSETDLASYILFGRAGAELSQEELDIASSGGSLAVGLLRPAVIGAASTGIQQLANSLGLPVNYVSLSLPGYGMGEFRNAWGASGAAALFQDAELEVGFDLRSNVSVIGSVRIPGLQSGQDGTSALRYFGGARVEFRPSRTWTVEGYVEDQYARMPSFGLTEIADRKVLGFSLFREWGY